MQNPMSRDSKLTNDELAAREYSLGSADTCHYVDFLAGCAYGRADEREILLIEHAQRNQRELLRYDAIEAEHLKEITELTAQLSQVSQERDKFKEVLELMVEEMQVFLNVSQKIHFPDARNAQAKAKELLAPVAKGETK